MKANQTQILSTPQFAWVSEEFFTFVEKAVLKASLKFAQVQVEASTAFVGLERTFAKAARLAIDKLIGCLKTFLE